MWGDAAAHARCRRRRRRRRHPDLVAAAAAKTPPLAREIHYRKLFSMPSAARAFALCFF